MASKHRGNSLVIHLSTVTWFGHHMVFERKMYIYIYVYATKSLAPRSGFKTWIPWQLFVTLPAIPNSVPLQKQNEFGERWPFPFSFLWTETRNWSAQSTAQQQGVLQSASRSAWHTGIRSQLPSIRHLHIAYLEDLGELLRCTNQK